jgi:hypothetical protein
MEKSNNQISTSIPHNCCIGMGAPKSAAKPENNKITVHNPVRADKDRSKPWSVFGDLYWV